MLNLSNTVFTWYSRKKAPPIFNLNPRNGISIHTIINLNYGRPISCCSLDKSNFMNRLRIRNNRNRVDANYLLSIVRNKNSIESNNKSIESNNKVFANRLIRLMYKKGIISA